MARFFYGDLKKAFLRPDTGCLAQRSSRDSKAEEKKTAQT
jgi:hypothetical protein